MTKNWNIYIRDGFMYIPTPGLTDAGFYIDVDPVEVVNMSNKGELKRVLSEALNKESPKIPAPTRAAFPKPAVLKYAGLKSWQSFHRTASCWVISRQPGSYIIQGFRRDGRGWEGDPDKIIIVPEEKGIDEVIRTFIAQVM